MFSRKIVASAAALTLGATGLVACSNDGEGEPTSTEIVSETATETEVATETAGEAADNTDAAAAGDAEATEEITTADGATAMVPAGVKAAMDEYAQPEWGEPMAVEETDGGWIVTYDNEHYITWNENTGGAPTWGQSLTSGSPTCVWTRSWASRSHRRPRTPTSRAGPRSLRTAPSSGPAAAPRMPSPQS